MEATAMMAITPTRDISVWLTFLDSMMKRAMALAWDNKGEQAGDLLDASRVVTHFLRSDKVTLENCIAGFAKYQELHPEDTMNYIRFLRVLGGMPTMDE